MHEQDGIRSVLALGKNERISPDLLDRSGVPTLAAFAAVR
jgi:hypothetical protein